MSDKLVLQNVVVDKKMSRRDTEYSIQKLPDEDVPFPTTRLTISTSWTRKDEGPDSVAKPEEPEHYDISTNQLIHWIQQSGAKVK